MLDRKACKVCKRIKPLSDYHIRAYGLNGKPYYDGTCKSCVLGKSTAPVSEMLIDGTCYKIVATSQTEGGKRNYYVLEHLETTWRGMWFPDTQRWSIAP